MNKKLPVLGIDVDGCLRQFILSIITTFQKHIPNVEIDIINNKKTRTSDFEFYNITKSFKNMSSDDVNDFWIYKHPKDVMLHAKQYDYASESMNRLRALGYPISIVTDQATDDLLRYTVGWLKIHKIKYDNMFCTSDKELTDCQIYVEDKPSTIEKIIKAGKKVLVFDHIYNRKLPDDVKNKVIRVYGWNEIVNILEEFVGVKKHAKISVTHPVNKS